uniref:Aminotran_1_2 domain-containing protein n=1 Tax=Heligmosomoides polygyrus TaxID=6339 RepID=A0A183FSP5_HELPZ
LLLRVFCACLICFCYHVVFLRVEFTSLAVECGAVNVGQGFPDEACPKFVTDLLASVAAHPEKTAWHQYTRGFGHLRLVNALARLYGGLYNREINANEQILVTVGAYLGLYYAFMGFVNHGDEVLIIDPAYDSYDPQVRMAGGVPVHYPMEVPDHAKSSSDFRIDLAKLRAKCSKKTKVLVLNNPNNPTGKLYTQEELMGIAEIVRDFNLIVIADEVYEWHVWDKKMIRFATLPGMFERTISIGSAGKAFSVTGWKLGWCIGPNHLMMPIKMMHQNCIFTCSTPTQEALACAFEKELVYTFLRLELFKSDPKSSYLLNGLPNELRTKCEKMCNMLSEAGFEPVRPDAGYFIVASFKNIDGPFKKPDSTKDPLDFRFVRWLCKEKVILSTLGLLSFITLWSVAKEACKCSQH